jgi:alpha-beta hydrolase superfamily lysophospholipase
LLTRIGVGPALGLGGIGSGIGIGAAAGIGWMYSSILLDPTQRPVFPERVLAADANTVMLTANRLTLQPGIWGLRWADGLGVIGPVLTAHRREVVREWLGGPVPAPGTPAVLDTGPYDPDPSGRGLDFEIVAVPGPLGDYRGWWIPAAARPGSGRPPGGAQPAGSAQPGSAQPGSAQPGSAQGGGRRSGGDRGAGNRPDAGGTAPPVVMVHGRGGSLRESLRVLPTLHERGHPVLVASYRNDEHAPPSPDGHYHLGDTEWTDLAAAVEYTGERTGSDRVILFGWSMGGAIIGAFLDRSPLADRVDAVVWDAPLVDWRATLRQQARNRRLPSALSPLAMGVTSLRIGMDFDRFDLRRHPPAVRPPTLLIHSDLDTAVPISASRALAADAHRLDWPIRMVEVAGVEHTGAWNADPAFYQRVVAEFLDGVRG